VRGLCQQHGTLQYFHVHGSAGQAVVTFSTLDEAAAAQQSLDSYVLAGSTLSVDFIPDAAADVNTQLSSSAPTELAASLSNIWASLPPSIDNNPTTQQHSVWHSMAGVWGASTGNL